MTNIDYLIVGGGLAGLCMARQCQNYKKSFVIIDNAQRTSSKIAGGMYNPVVLKRFTSIWEAQAQIEIAYAFYPKLEKDLNTNFFYKIPIFRKFASIEEQNNWFVASDNPVTEPYLNPKLYFHPFQNIPSEFGFGEVYDTGYLDVKHFIQSYQSYLKKEKHFITSDFCYNELKIEKENIQCQNIVAKHIIFAEGFSLHQNPFFNYLPLDGTKGELLYVKIPNLKLKHIVKSSIFIIPIGNDVYKIGATYNWQDKTDQPTEEAKIELINELHRIVDSPYQILQHFAGVRPTVKDRRPLVGQHFSHNNVYILNGLGTRGVLLAPYLAEKLIKNIEENLPLDPNINVARYYKKLQIIK